MPSDPSPAPDAPDRRGRRRRTHKLRRRLLAVFLLVLTTWLTGFVEQFTQLVPSPQRTWRLVRSFPNDSGLALMNPFVAPPSNEKFRFVLCWLQDDWNGSDTKTVASAFRNVPGVDFARSARIVAAAPPSDSWEQTIRDRAGPLLDRWQADLLIVGEVVRPGESVNLWFIPREGRGTLRPGASSFHYIDETWFDIKSEFHQELRAQLAAFALSAVTATTDTATRNEVLIDALQSILDRMQVLHESRTITDSTHLRQLYLARGNALLALGERTGDPDRLEQSVTAYNQALQVVVEEDRSQASTTGHNNLGIAHAQLGRLRGDTAHFRQAVTAFKTALGREDRGEDPAAWAGTRGNLGTVWSLWGDQVGRSAYLQQGVDMLREAAAEIPREHAPFDWAMAKNNLGVTMMLVGSTEDNPARLERAIGLFDTALGELTPEGEPLSWTGARINLANTLVLLGGMTADRSTIEDAIRVLQVTLEEETLEADVFEQAGLYWVAANGILGSAYAVLGELSADPTHFEEALRFYGLAFAGDIGDLPQLGRIGMERSRGSVLRSLGEITHDQALLRQAVAAHRGALNVCRRETAPLCWAEVQITLGDALLSLGRHTNDTSLHRQAVRAYREAVNNSTPDQPAVWASAQYHLGVALTNLAVVETQSYPEPVLRDAVRAFDAALTVYSSEVTPSAWAATEENRARVLFELGSLVSQPVELWMQAVNAYRTALAAYSPERQPSDWARVHVALGTTLDRLGRWTASPVLVEEAVDALNEAAAVHSRQVGAKWANTKRALGGVLLRLGRMKGEAVWVEASVDAYKTALAVYTRERNRLVGPPRREVQIWAEVQTDVGLATAELAKLTGNTHHYGVALDAFNMALRAQTAEWVPRRWLFTQISLATALVNWDEQEPDSERLNRAVRALNAALQADPNGELGGRRRALEMLARINARLELRREEAR